MTNNGTKAVERELAAGVEDFGETDLTLDDETHRKLLEAMRHQLVIDYTRLQTNARLNDKVGNKEAASQNREDCKKLVQQVAELDRLIKEHAA